MAVFVIDDVVCPALPAEAVVGGHDLVFIGDGLAGGDEVGDVGADGVVLFGRDDGEEGFAEQLLLVAFKVGAVGGVDVGEGGVWEEAADEVILDFYEAAVAGGVFSDLLVHVGFFKGVADGAGEAFCGEL